MRRWLLTVLCSAALTSALYAQGVLRIDQDNEALTITLDQRPVAKYLRNPAGFKPYVAELCSPGGVQVLRDSPFDHKHHHGLMFAVNVNGVEFWGREDEKCGRQISQRIEEVQTASADGRQQARFVELLDWQGPDGKSLLRERRSVCLHAPLTPAATLLTWHSRLEPAEGLPSVELVGRNYEGLGVRFLESMDKVGRMRAADDVPGEPDKTSMMYPARWLAYTAPADGRPVTVVLFDHPQNARHPARFFTMLQPFSYVSATLGLDKQALPLEAGKPLELRYAAAVLDGEADASRIEAVYQQWLRLP